MAFFLVYHSAAVVCMRRVARGLPAASPVARRRPWPAIVAAPARFFAFMETRPDSTDEAEANVWYVELGAMLRLGTFFYALYFVVSFPTFFRLDERPDRPGWSLGRTVIEASFVA